MNSSRRGHPRPVGDYKADPNLWTGGEVVAQQVPESSLSKSLGRLVLLNQPEMQPRNEFIKRYPHWIPYSKAEASIAVSGLAPRLTILHGKISKTATAEDALMAVGRTLDDTKAYKRQAYEAAATLQSIYDFDNDQQPTATQVIYSRKVRAVLAEFLLSKQSLDAYKWQPRKQKGGPNKRRQAKLEQIESDIRLLGEEDALWLYEMARAANQERLRFWDREIDSVKNMPIVQELDELIDEKYKEAIKAEWESIDLAVEE
ncbi:hypothetical protein KW789_00040 [Candidatus Saccharibacteria bacterium]|nr:hypothetical protein [Candidatus Saccharibacteria bacterium]